MNLQTVLLTVYGITQLAQVIMEQLKETTGITDEELKKMWEEQKGEFLAATDLWKASGK